MIKLKVTDEMIEAYRAGYTSKPVLRKIGNREEHERDGLRAVLDIIERELNKKRGDLYVAILHNDPGAIRSEIISYEEDES